MSVTFVPKFKDGQVCIGAEARKKLGVVIDNQLLTKTIHGNILSLRVGEALKFTSEMARTKRSTAPEGKTKPKKMIEMTTSTH
jgi:hypothetical protein